MSGTRVRIALHQMAAKAASDAALHNSRAAALLSKLVALSQGERLAPSMLERLLTNDKAWASLLLAAASASAFGEQRARFRTVKEAVSTAGAPWVLAAALDVGCVLLYDELCRADLCATKDMATHALAVGAGAAWLAPRNGVDRTTAHLAGLLHNVGIPAAKDEPPEVRPASEWEPVEESVEPVRPWHALVGKEMLDGSGLPAEYGEVALRHHDPEPDGLCLVVQVADLLAQQMGCSVSGPSHSPELASQLLAQANLHESDYAEVCEAVGSAIPRAAKIIACR